MSKDRKRLGIREAVGEWFNGPVSEPKPITFCLVLFLIGVLLLEGIVGLTVGYLCFRSAIDAIQWLGWEGDSAGAFLAAFFPALIAAFIPVAFIDKWCERRTGHSPLTMIPAI